jgi:hypothetical protein
MDMSALLNTPATGPLSTAVKVCKEGDYKAVIDDGEKWLQFKEFTKDGRTSYQAQILFSILDDGIRKDLGRDKVLVPYTMWLDMDSGKLDTSDGKNVSLGRLLEIVDLNKEAAANYGEKVMKLRGKGPFVVKVSQRSDQNDPTIKYAEIKRVSKLT